MANTLLSWLSHTIGFTAPHSMALSANCHLSSDLRKLWHCPRTLVDDNMVSRIIITPVSLCTGALKIANHFHMPQLAERITTILEQKISLEFEQQQIEQQVNFVHFTTVCTSIETCTLLSVVLQVHPHCLLLSTCCIRA